MSTPTHLLIGAVIAKTAMLYGFSDTPQQTYLVSLFSSVLPDIDVVTYGYGPQHHKSLFHKPFFWGCIIVFLFIFQALFGLIPLNDIYLISLALFSHFILDTGNYTEGVQWFWPLSKKTIHFFKLVQRPDTRKERKQLFMHHATFFAETLIVLGSLFYLFAF